MPGATLRTLVCVSEFTSDPLPQTPLRSTASCPARFDYIHKSRPIGSNLKEFTVKFTTTRYNPYVLYLVFHIVLANPYETAGKRHLGSDNRRNT